MAPLTRKPGFIPPPAPPESYKAGLPESILGLAGVESHALAPTTRPPTVRIPAALAPAEFRPHVLGIYIYYLH